MSDVLERFLRYVQVDSQSNAAFADQTPSTACQHDMARVLAADLLTFRGLPCPNLVAGGVQFHSIREFIAVSSLESGVDFLERLVAKFAVEQ